MTTTADDYNSVDFRFGAGMPGSVGDTLPAKVGEPAPDFHAVGLDGVEVHLNELRGSHIVLMSGAITSPMCAYEAPGLNLLQRKFADKDIRFFLLYTRESHPAENYPDHTSFQQKSAHARDLQLLEQVEVPILVDTVDGAIHRRYGPWPASLFVIDKQGRLVYRANMANTPELEQFLDDLVAADEHAAAGELLHELYSERLVPHLADRETHHRVYERAGPQAFEDDWRRVPSRRNKWP